MQTLLTRLKRLLEYPNYLTWRTVVRDVIQKSGGMLKHPLLVFVDLESERLFWREGLAACQDQLDRRLSGIITSRCLLLLEITGGDSSVLAQIREKNPIEVARAVKIYAVKQLGGIVDEDLGPLFPRPADQISAGTTVYIRSDPDDDTSPLWEGQMGQSGIVWLKNGVGVQNSYYWCADPPTEEEDSHEANGGGPMVPDPDASPDLCNQ
jgi:hypothetical protein